MGNFSRVVLAPEFKKRPNFPFLTSLLSMDVSVGGTDFGWSDAGWHGDEGTKSAGFASDPA